MPAPSASRSIQKRLHEPGTSSAPAPAREINGRIDQLALVQSTLQNGASPTLVTGFAMINAQRQTQATHPDMILTITSSIG